MKLNEYLEILHHGRRDRRRPRGPGTNALCLADAPDLAVTPSGARYKRYHKPHKSGNIDERSNGSLMPNTPGMLISPGSNHSVAKY